MELSGFNKPLLQVQDPREELIKRLQAQQQGQGKGGFQPLALIAEGGGLGGALAGGAAGATLGSVVPGIGTAIGGLIGAGLGGFLGGTAGSMTEQQVRDKKVDPGKALKFGAVEGVTSAGPIKLLKAGKAAYSAARAGAAAKPAVEEALSKSLLGKVGRKATGDSAARTFAQAFTVPSKLAPRLKPVDTAKELLDYGVSGSLQKMKRTADLVTGSNGILAKATRDAVARIPGDVKIESAAGAARNALQGSMLDPQQEKKIVDTVLRMDKPGILPGTMNPVDALDNVKDLERIGYQYVNSSTKLSPNLQNEQVGHAYLAAADEIKDSLERAVGNQDILTGLKTPALVKQLEAISPKLAQQFVGAKSLADLRSIQAPFVRLNQMIGLTEDAAQSVVPQALSGTAGRLGAGGIGAMAGGPVGAAAGFLAAPFVQGIEQATRAPIATGAARLINRSGRSGTSKSLLSRVNNTGTRALAGAGAADALTNKQPENDLLTQLSASGGVTGPQDLMGNSSQSPQTDQDWTPLLTGQSQSQEGSAEYYLAGAQRAAEAGDLDTAKTLMGMASTVTDLTGASSKLSTTQQKGVLSMQNALAQVNQLEGLYGQAGGGQGRVGGAVSGLLGKVGANATAQAYRQKRAGAATLIARALGESGTMTDQDIKRAVDQIPDITDTPQEAEIKWGALRQILSQVGQNTLALPGASGNDSLLSQLNGTGANYATQY